MHVYVAKNLLSRSRFAVALWWLNRETYTIANNMAGSMINETINLWIVLYEDNNRIQYSTITRNNTFYEFNIIKILTERIWHSYNSLKIRNTWLKKTKVALWENTLLGLRQIPLLKNRWFQIKKLWDSSIYVRYIQCISSFVEKKKISRWK